MKKLFVLLALLLSYAAIPQTDPLAGATAALSHEILVNGQAYANLKELVSIGSRLSGSPNAAQAVAWGQAKMQSYGFDQIRLEPVRVPHWERGSTERASVSGLTEGLRITALGGSIATPEGGITAPVIEVPSLEAVDALGERARGKIIFYNGPMDPAQVDTFAAYGAASGQRFSGAARAAKLGAVAVLVRSLNLREDDHPHTGMMRYQAGVPKIPAAALSTRAANRLSAQLKNDPSAQVSLELSSRPLDPVDSSNVLGEITGSEKPGEIVLVGGHLDSWDLGPGAQDDGAGVVQSLEVLRAIRALGLRPKRTIRAVLFMTEEMGGIGGIQYAKDAAAGTEKHVAAIESDCGGFSPRGFSVEGSDRALAQLRGWGKYLSPIYSDLAVSGGSGTDIEPLAPTGAALFGLMPDSQRYFDYHHSEVDTLDAVNPRELQLGASAMAVLAYLIADQGI